MRGGQPRTYKQAVVWAALIVGTPLVVSTVLDVVFDEVSWTMVLLNFAIWLAISALVALAFSGGVESRRGRDEGRDNLVPEDGGNEVRAGKPGHEVRDA